MMIITLSSPLSVPMTFS